MLAVVATRPGGPEVLELIERPRPRPGPRDVLVRVRASGVNRADLLQRRGAYPAPPGWPADIPGLEFAGVVAELGDAAVGASVGDRVMGIVGGGGYAEYVVVPDDHVVRIPEAMSTEDAGAIPEVFMTAYDALTTQAGLGSGEVLLVHAAASGVGTAALQLGAGVGARVIGTSRSPDKLAAVADLGLTVPVEAGPDWPDRVLEATAGKGVDVILDLVGAGYLEGNQRVLAHGGRHIVVGLPSGAVAPIDLRALMGRRGTLRGTVLRARSRIEKAELARAFERDVLPGLEAGRLRPVCDRRLPAAEAAAAHALLEANLTTGKVVLLWD